MKNERKEGDMRKEFIGVVVSEKIKKSPYERRFLNTTQCGLKSDVG